MQILFDGHRLDTNRRELSRGTEPVALEPLVFDLLVYLVMNRDRVVSKDDVLDQVWSGRIVSESALTTRIAAARRAIGDSGESQKLIRTIPRKGFRFVGEVREDTDSLSGLPETRPPDSARPAALVLPDKPSIAVLPFANMSPDPEQEFFADGIADDIIADLSREHSLFVISRNSSFTYKGARGRCQTRWTGTWRALPAGRQYPSRRDTDPRQCPVDRGRDRQPSLG